jgi:type II secretory pathway component GspD/PulD (secretin)
LNLDQVTFEQAMNAVALVTRTYWSPVSSTEVLVAADTPAKHKELDRWWVRTFYIPQATTPQELTDIVNLLRTLFEIRFVTSAPAGGTITVRGPAPVIQAATQFLQTLWVDRPQVMLDFDVYEISGQMLRSMGVSLPLQFNLFNIPESVVSLLNNGQLTQLASQLNTSGNLGQLNGSNLSALVAQLGLSASQQSELTALLQNPVATFGGGLTMFGVSIPPATVSFSKSDSRVISLDKVSMRAAQGNAATFRLGSRYPILNASYTAFSPLLSGSTSLANFPSFTYEDLGISIKAKPTIRDTDVVLDLEMEVKSLGAQSVNSIPIINNRSFKGVITVKNNEPAVVAGALSRNDQKSLSGIPGISQLTGLGLATSSRSDEVDEDELLVMITPHILSGVPADTRAIVVPTGY